MAKLLRDVSNNVSAVGKPLYMNLHTSLIAAWDWSQKLDLLSNLAKFNHLTSEIFLFSPMGLAPLYLYPN